MMLNHTDTAKKLFPPRVIWESVQKDKLDSMLQLATCGFVHKILGNEIRPIQDAFLTETSFGLRVLSLSLCVCVCPSVCVYVRVSVNHELVRTITQQPFKLGSPNLDHRCKRLSWRSLMFWWWLTLTFKVKLTSKSKFTPFWVCEFVHAISHHWLKDFQIWTKMHLSTVRIPIDFGIDWPRPSVVFLISNQLFFLQTPRLLFICVVLYIFSDAIATMMFCSSIAGCVHGKWKLEYHVVWHLTSLRQANIGNDMKNILYISFSNFALTETHRCQNYPLSLYKKISRVDPFTGNESKPSLKLSDCGRKIRNDVHVDTYFCKPELVSWR